MDKDGLVTTLDYQPATSRIDLPAPPVAAAACVVLATRADVNGLVRSVLLVGLGVPTEN